MKITRRTFIGAVAAAALTAKDAFGFFRKNKTLRHEAAVDILRYRTQGEPHKSCAYIYNAGMDFEGIQGHTFNRYGVLPGGKVTRIDQCEEWTLRGIHDWHTTGRRVHVPPGTDQGRSRRRLGVLHDCPGIHDASKRTLS